MAWFAEQLLDHNSYTEKPYLKGQKTGRDMVLEVSFFSTNDPQLGTFLKIATLRRKYQQGGRQGSMTKSFTEESRTPMSKYGSKPAVGICRQ